MSNEYRVLIQPEAYEGMEGIYRYLEANASAARAAKWAKGVMEAVRSLNRFPTRCPTARENEFFQEEIRQLLYGKGRNSCRILFTIQENVVSVLYIRHSAQDTVKPSTEQTGEQEDV